MAGKLQKTDDLVVAQPGTAAPEQAALLAAIVESSNDAIVSKDLNGIITSWNPAAERIFGYKPAEIIGKSVLTIIPPDLSHEEDEILRKLRAGQRIEHHETERVTKDGRRVAVSLTISPLRDSSGKIIGASKIARDISERRRTDEDRFRLAAIVDSSDDAIVSKDLNGVIKSWNAAAQRLFGYTPEEIVGKSVLTIIPPELQDQEPEILRKLGAGERIEHFETERVCKNGRRVWVSLTISPIKDPAGRVIGASKIARDITERKRVQEALIQSEKLAATGRMAAAIAHEINNPLEAVTNLAYLISVDPNLHQKVRSYADLLLQEVGRASEIAKQSLAFYRESGKPGTFKVTDLLDNVLNVNRQRLERRGIEVVRQYRSSATLYGFASEMRQVFANLVLNAMDAIPDSGKIVIRTSTYTCVDATPKLRISVGDNGSGIPVENRKRLFEPFFTTKMSHGNGLGLWVSLGIAEKHGGRIRVRSCTRQDHSGTVFSLSVPLKEKAIPKQIVA